MDATRQRMRQWRRAGTLPPLYLKSHLGLLYSCTPDAVLRARGAAGPRELSAKCRVSDAGKFAALRGYAARVSPADLRQSLPRLHPYPYGQLAGTF